MQPERHVTRIALHSRCCILGTQTTRQRLHRLGRRRGTRRSYGTAAVFGRNCGDMTKANHVGNRGRGRLRHLKQRCSYVRAALRAR
jgi:hypothetical protein